MGKHSNESDDTSAPSAHKKPRLTPKPLSFEDIVAKADVVLGLIPEMQAYIKEHHPQHLETLDYWRYTCKYAKQVGVIWEEPTITMLDKRLPNDSEYTLSNHHSRSVYTVNTRSYVSIVQPNVRNLQFYSKTETILPSCALRIRQKLESVSKQVQRSFPVLSSTQFPWVAAVYSSRCLSSILHRC